MKGKKRFLKFLIEHFKHISRCPGVNSSKTVITKWFKNRLAGVCHFISQKNIKTCLAKPDEASFYMLVLVRLFKEIFTQEFVFDIASLYYKKIIYFTLNVPAHMFRSLRCIYFNLSCEICIQLNLSWMATLVTEESGRCRKGARVERWPLVEVTLNTGYRNQ